MDDAVQVPTDEQVKCLNEVAKSVRAAIAAYPTKYEGNRRVLEVITRIITGQSLSEYSRGGNSNMQSSMPKREPMTVTETKTVIKRKKVTKNKTIIKKRKVTEKWVDKNAS